MIGPGFYPLVVGLGVTSILVAYEDMRTGGIHNYDWLPALIGAAYFYLTSGLPSLLFSGFLALAMVGGTWATLKIVKKRNQDAAVVGQGDYIAVALFSFWPVMVVYVIVYALTVGIAGFYLKWWNRGLRGIPLAGLMGIFCLLYIAYLAV